MELTNFLQEIEAFLDDALEPDARGNVFVSENGDGFSLNLIIGAEFEGTVPEINQVNLLIVPTDREFLGLVSHEEQSVNNEDQETEQSNVGNAFDEALRIL